MGGDPAGPAGGPPRSLPAELHSCAGSDDSVVPQPKRPRASPTVGGSAATSWEAPPRGQYSLGLPPGASDGGPPLPGWSSLPGAAEDLYRAVLSSPDIVQGFFDFSRSDFGRGKGHGVTFPWPYEASDAAWWVGEQSRIQKSLLPASAGSADLDEDLVLPICCGGCPSESSGVRPRVVGQVAAERRDDGRLWLSYFVSAEHAGRGVATQAVKDLLLFIAAHWPGIEAIYLRCFSDNMGSVRVAQKLGAEHLETVPPGSIYRHPEAVRRGKAETAPVETYRVHMGQFRRG